MKLNLIHILLFIFFTQISFASSSLIDELEHKVYELNNEFNYSASHSLIIGFINKHQKPYLKSRAYIFLAHTYKRVFDYNACRKALKNAYKQALISDNKREAEVLVLYEMSLMEFDLQNYEESRDLMRSITSIELEDLKPEFSSNLLMQEAYLLYKDKKYDVSEKAYNKAIKIKAESKDICHLPNLYVKKMELYNAMNDTSKMNASFQQAISIADSCNILKYKLYAYEILYKIYRTKNDYKNAVLANDALSEINEQYKANTHKAELIRLNSAFESKLKDKEIEHQISIKKRFILISILLIALLVAGYLFFRSNKKLNVALDEDNDKMRFEIISFTNLVNQLETEVAQKEKLIETVQRNAIENERKILQNQVVERKEKETSSIDNFIHVISNYDLTDRQINIAKLIYEGKSNKEISQTLFISENTVKYHIKKIYFVLDIKNRTELVLIQNSARRK